MPQEGPAAFSISRKGLKNQWNFSIVNMLWCQGQKGHNGHDPMALYEAATIIT